MHFALLKDNNEDFNDALKKLPPGLVDRCAFRVLCLAAKGFSVALIAITIHYWNSN